MATTSPTGLPGATALPRASFPVGPAAARCRSVNAGGQTIEVICAPITAVDRRRSKHDPRAAMAARTVPRFR
jgi:hypothetical protein